MKKELKPTGLEIAVIGMAGRFPGAANIEEFHRNLENGIESITFFSKEQLAEAGVPAHIADHPDYVPAAGVLADKDCFDAPFFGYSAREAEVMDPQFRVFHEVAWETLEHAGYVPEQYSGSIGLYMGATPNLMWEARPLLNGQAEVLGEFDTALLANKDFLATRISYRLNLKGPSFTLACACSTSLVAVHLAVRALLTGECQMALAGGVALFYPDDNGYVYQEGMINSPDGHCRAFDARSKGTIFGSGAGAVLLKRLKDAQAQGDTIHAVIKGSAVNNDGNRKVGYTAPSTQGQADVIRTAIKTARISPESITYIETHGTGTQMGDTMEAEAMKSAFDIDKKGYCAVASVKTNIGHLDAAAGVAGFIKAVLALKNKRIPPSLNYETPNPNIDFDSSPFFVNTRLLEWHNDEYPLRAGVSSFGVGGTNAHVVLEEAPMEDVLPEKKDQEEREYKLLVMSAKNAPALNRITENLADFLENNSDTQLIDAAYTMQVGRKYYKHRRMLVCKDIPDAVDRLRAEANSGKIHSHDAADENRPLVFMFTGLGAQYVNMGRDLYRNEPLFREEMDRCLAILKELGVGKVETILYPADDPIAGASSSGDSSRGNSIGSNSIHHTDVSQPAIFIIQYALARLMITWGFKPTALIGYSFGEYAAACIAGIFSLEDALKLVVIRSRLVSGLPNGIMLSVPVTKEQLMPLLADRPDLSFAIDNGPSCIVGGTPEAVETFESILKQQRLISMRLGSQHAVHTHMMEPVLQEFRAAVASVDLKPPTISLVSNVTGTFITDEQVMDPGYWAQHLRETVQFDDGICTLDAGNELSLPIYVEIGPGRDLSTLVGRTEDNTKGRQVVNLLQGANSLQSSAPVSDVFYLLSKAGFLWLYGKRPKWKALYSEGNPHRIPLPTYPFEKILFKADGDMAGLIPAAANALGVSGDIVRNPDPSRWFYLPSWKPLLLPTVTETKNNTVGEKNDPQTEPCKWLVFADPFGLTETLIPLLCEQGNRAVVVSMGNEFRNENPESDSDDSDPFNEFCEGRFTLDSDSREDYIKLFAYLREMDFIPQRILHLWNVEPLESLQEFREGPVLTVSGEILEQHIQMGFFSLLHLMAGIRSCSISEDVQLTVITTGMQEVSDEGISCPGKAAALGPLKVFPQEYPFMRCRSIDLSAGLTRKKLRATARQLVDDLLLEPSLWDSNPEIAYRSGRRWTRSFDPVSLPYVSSTSQRLPFKPKGVYLITGGLGGMGLAIAEFLIETFQARLILVGRTPLPPRDQWKDIIETNGTTTDQSLVKKIAKLLNLDASGAQIMCAAADAADYKTMAAVVEEAENRFGSVNGIFHSAGIVSGASFLPGADLTETACREQFRPKLEGIRVLERIFYNHDLDFCLLSSSIASVLGGVAFSAYASSNLLMDAYTASRGRDARPSLPWVAVNWDSWIFDEVLLERGFAPQELVMGPKEGIDAMCRIMARPDARRVVHSLGDLQARIDRWIKLESLRQQPKDIDDTQTGTRLQRPDLMTQYVAPRNETEIKLADIWCHMFGFETVGIHDNFFELGGDSLKVISITAKILRILQIEISVPEFFANPTIEDLAKLAATGETVDYIPISPVQEQEFYPLSSAQKRLFIIQQLEKDSIGYNESIIMSLDGDIPLEKLEEPFRKLIRRHESLRTSFHVIEDEAVQKVHPPESVAFQMEVFDVQQQSLSQVEILNRFSRAFDLSVPPLFRAALIKTGELQNTIAVEMHHIISDGHSYEIFTREYMSFYNGEENKLKPLTLQYKDFAVWQNSEAQRTVMEKQETYWLELFGGEIPQLHLPTDYPRPEVKSFEGVAVEYYLTPEQSDRLRKMAEAGDGTLFMLVMTLFNILMFKLSGQEDLIVGTPVFGRRREELQHIIGMFVNTLAMRSFPQNNKTFRQYLNEVIEATLEAFDNQDYQFEELVEKLGIKPDPGRNPLFDVLFTQQNVEFGGYDLPDYSSAEDFGPSQHQHQLQQAQFDIIMFFHEAGPVLSFKMVYGTKLFKHETAARFWNYFTEIVDAVLENDLLPLKDIKISHQLGKATFEMPDTEFDF